MLKGQLILVNRIRRMVWRSAQRWTGKQLFRGLRVLGIVLFVVILFRVELGPVGEALLNTDPRLLVLGILMQWLLLVSKGIRWHLMNDGRGSWKYWAQSLGRFYESYAIGVVTPGRVGDLLKAGHESGLNNVLSAGFRVLAERGIDIGIFMGLAGLWVLSGHYRDIRPVFGWAVIGGGGCVLLGSCLILASRAFSNQVNRMLLRLPARLGDLSVEGKSYPAGVTAWILLLSLASNVGAFVSSYYLARAAGLEAGFVWIAGTVAVAGLLNMLPVTIMGLGTRELVFLYAFQGLDPGRVLAFSFLVLLVAQIGGGLVSLLAGQSFLWSTRRYRYD